MVYHAHTDPKIRDYWTLPGGAIENGETPEEAVVREVFEETGLRTKVTRFLFEVQYLIDDTSKCFLLELLDPDSNAQKGYDPEENHLPDKERTLQDVRWHSIDSMKDDIQVSKVLKQLNHKYKI